MEVFRQALNSSRFRPDPKLPTEFLMTLLFFVLTFNLFVFLAADLQHSDGNEGGAHLCLHFHGVA